MIKLKDLLNEVSRPATRKEMAEWINTFNNANFKNVKGGRMLFVASKFALKGMNKELKGTRINIIDTGETDKSGLPIYAFDLKDKNKFHWGVDESIEEGRWSSGVGNPKEAEKYGDVLHGDTFDPWRKKMKDLLNTKDISRSAYDLWIDKIKNAKSSKETAKVTRGIKGIRESVNERQYADTYFDTFREAAEFAASLAEKEGYQIDEDDWFKQVATGGRYSRSRPSKGKTHRFSVQLLKRGKPAKKALHFQVYGMESGKYELNAYIN